MKRSFITIIIMMLYMPFQIAQVQSGKGIIHSGGIPFSYVREGKGCPVFVIGSSGYSRFFSGNLRNHYEMIFTDSRHFIPEYNPSQEELAALSLDTWAGDMEMIRKELGLNKIIVIGHSVHAQIAMRYAARYEKCGA